MQVDNFLYMDGLGFVIFLLLVSRISIAKKEQEKQGILPTKQPNALFYRHASQGLRAA